MLSEKEFLKQLEEVKNFIRSTVSVFPKDNPAMQQKRIAKAETDKFYFAKTYFPHYCVDDFSDDHKELFEIADTYNTPVLIGGYRELGKSTIVSFIDEIHKTLYKKNLFTVYCCDTQETAAEEFLLPIRAELEENPRIINDFGNLKTQFWTATDFRTSTGKRFLALGPKMGAKGKKNKGTRPDRIIVEDFENINSSKKKNIIKRRVKFLLKDLGKSVNFKRWQFFFIGNYFSKKTVFHYLLTADECRNWKKRIYSALKEVKGKLVSAWEARMPLKQLLQEQSEDPVTFRTERLQKPEDDEAIFKEEWFVKKKLNEYNLEGLPVVTYFDPSALRGQEHDFKAIITLAVQTDPFKIFVIHAWIKKDSKWKAINEHFKISKRFKSCADGVESVGFQATLREDYEKLEQTIYQPIPIKMINNRLPKETRIGRLSSLVERGIIEFCVDKECGDTNELLEQLIDFPDGEHDDGPDALAGAVEVAETFVTRTFKKVNSTIIEY
ncbi:MAG: hypothetical protein K1X86_16825 [Ignavibacteria bacterium]|nr:hypothetical protein [Ignavibacteria bacterium]